MSGGTYLKEGGGGGGGGTSCTTTNVIIHGYNTVVHDFPRFLGNYAHAQMVDTRPLFRRGMCPVNEVTPGFTIINKLLSFCKPFKVVIHLLY